MNDEFLHRMRKPPSPEFLQGLKARLDRQPPLGRAPPSRRRWTFTRGLLAGLLLGGAAFAFLARLIPGPEPVPPDVRQKDVVPLGPVWLPTHVAPRLEPPKVPTEAAGLTRHDNGGAGPASAPAAEKSPNSGGVPYFEQVTVVASSTAYPIARNAASHFGRGAFGQARVEINSAKPFDRLCTNDPAPADIVELTRRITHEEFARCRNTRAFGIVEVKVGYQAVFLGRAQLYGPLRLTSRDVFLALARRVPDPNRPERLVDNPYTSWNQIDPALPYDRIQVIGPAPGTPQGKLAGSLLLEPGCNTFWPAALRESDPARYEQICGSLREDSAYQPASKAGWAYLTTNPTAIGVFSLGEYRSNRDGLTLIPIDDIAPTQESVYANAYPLSRSLYLYTSSQRSLGNQVFLNFVRYNMTARDFYANDPVNGWGFVQLAAPDINANLAIAQERRELQF